MSSSGSSRTSTSLTTLGWSSFLRMAISRYTLSNGLVGTAPFPSRLGRVRPGDQHSVIIMTSRNSDCHSIVTWSSKCGHHNVVIVTSLPQCGHHDVVITTSSSQHRRPNIIITTWLSQCDRHNTVITIFSPQSGHTGQHNVVIATCHVTIERSSQHGHHSVVITTWSVTTWSS